MPESRARKKASYTPAPKASAPRPSPAWYAPVMAGLFLLGLAYIVTFYVTESRYPIPQIGQANILVGFAVIMAGFAMATRWR